MNKTASCLQCDKKFSKSTQLLADQALRMHVGRTHDKNINPALSRRSSSSNNGSLAVNSRGHLSDEESDVLVKFLRDHHKSYPTRQACFTAGLEAVGVQDKIKDNSGAVIRYFKKALGVSEKSKRSYVRRSQAPVVQEVKINFCPNCGCNIHAVATGIALAHIK